MPVRLNKFFNFFLVHLRFHFILLTIKVIAVIHWVSFLPWQKVFRFFLFSFTASWFFRLHRIYSLLFFAFFNHRIHNFHIFKNLLFWLVSLLRFGYFVFCLRFGLGWWDFGLLLEQGTVRFHFLKVPIFSNAAGLRTSWGWNWWQICLRIFSIRQILPHWSEWLIFLIFHKSCWSRFGTLFFNLAVRSFIFGFENKFLLILNNALIWLFDWTNSTFLYFCYFW